MPDLDTVLSPNLTGIDAEAYEQFVKSARGGHFSQTRDWVKVVAAGRPVRPAYFLARRHGRVVGAAAILRPLLWGHVPLPLAQLDRGPVCDDPDDLPAVISTLVKHTRRAGIIRLSVMPYWSGEAASRTTAVLLSRGFSDVQTYGGSHVQSLRLDLTQMPLKGLFEGSRFYGLRKQVAFARRHGAAARRGKPADMVAFQTMHETLLRRERLRIPSSRWYNAVADYFFSGNQGGAMFVCELDADLVSAVFVVRQGSVATFAFGASTSRKMPFTKMIWPITQAIEWAKSEGLSWFDLGGIPMTGDTDPRRASIATFKSKFGGEPVSFVHEFARWF